MLPVAKLFYNLMEELIDKSKIIALEVEKLKTKEYTKSLFKATDYRTKKLDFNGADIYISTQFFESDREAVIEWYKEHLS